MEWQEVEMLGYTHFASKGYRILIPLVSNEGYDFVAEKEGEFVRVNVKKAGLKDKRDPRSWSISQSSGGCSTSRDRQSVDVYLTWMPEQKRFIEIEGGFLNGGNSKSRRIPSSLYLS